MKLRTAAGAALLCVMALAGTPRSAAAEGFAAVPDLMPPKPPSGASNAEEEYWFHEFVNYLLIDGYNRTRGNEPTSIKACAIVLTKILPNGPPYINDVMLCTTTANGLALPWRTP